MISDAIIRVRCPNCKRTAKAKEKVLGRQITCPHCRTVVQFKRVTKGTQKAQISGTSEKRVKARCPNCASIFKAKKKVLGCRITCPKCKGTVQLERMYASEDEYIADVAKKTVSTGVDAAKKLFSFGKQKYVEHQERQRERMERERAVALRRRPHFLGEGGVLEAHGYTVNDPMIYVAECERVQNADASLLCLKQPVAAPRHESPHSLGYWPCLSECAPHQIGNYLQWLATGKNHQDVDLGYVFLYFYGLERRSLIDGQDCQYIVLEVLRLIKIYGHSNSFRGYGMGLILHLISLRRIDITSDLINCLIERQGRHVGGEFQTLLLGYLAETRQSLSAKWALKLAQQDERAKRSVVIERAPEEFERLFSLKYYERFATKMIPAIGDRSLTLEYRPASPTLPGYGPSVPKATWPSVKDWRRQFAPVVKAYNECIEELKVFARKAHAEGRDSVLAYEALPSELQAEAEHPRQAEWDALLEEFTPEEGPVLVPVSRLAALRDITYREKLTQSQGKSIAEFAETFGVSLEPDSRFTRKAYGWSNKVAVLRLPDEPKTPETHNFALTGMLMPLALEVSLASGNVERDEQKVIQEFMEERFMLTQNESLRAGALIHVLLANGVSIKGLKSKIQKQFSDVQVNAIGKFLVMIAAAADGICSEEVDALQITFKALGLKRELVDEFIAKLGYEHPDQPVLVDEGEADSDAEVIPGPTHVLDPDKIGILIEANREITTILANAMGDSGSDNESSSKVDDGSTRMISATESSILFSIPANLMAFYCESLNRSEWSQEELGELAGRHSTTYAAAVDHLNEIFMEHFDDPLFEGEEVLVVHPKAPRPEGDTA